MKASGSGDAETRELYLAATQMSGSLRTTATPAELRLAHHDRQVDLVALQGGKEVDAA